MVARRRLLVGSVCSVVASRASAASLSPEAPDRDQLGKADRVLGRPGGVAPGAPRIALPVWRLGEVDYPNDAAAWSSSRLSERGCAIEGPGHVLENRASRLAYAACLADAIKEARWG